MKRRRGQSTATVEQDPRQREVPDTPSGVPEHEEAHETPVSPAETSGEAERSLYNVYVSEKIPFEARDTAHEHMPPEMWVEQNSEEVEEGAPARYGAWLTDRGAEAFDAASNCEEVVPAERHEVLGSFETTAEARAQLVEASSVLTHGVNREALDFHRFFGAGGGVGREVAVMVADTGYRWSRYLADKFLFGWSWFPTWRDGHGHAYWVTGAAVPQGAKLITAKVLGDDGVGYDTYGIAALYRFVRWCIANEKFGVANYSLGGGNGQVNRGYEEAAQFALANGVLPTAAAGNNSWDGRISAPANSPWFLSVGAINRRVKGAPRADFSNQARHLPLIFAAGVAEDGQGGRMSGTSMADPLVSRAAARVIGLPQIKTAQRARRILISSSVGRAKYGSGGRLDVTRAIDLAKVA